MKRTVAIGFIGATLDRLGKGAARWQKWRPSIGLCQQPDLLIDRLELIHGNDARDLGLAERIRADIAAVSPHTEVRLQQMELRNPWDFEEVYGALHDFVSAYPFDTEREDYLVHITTGTHVAQICWFLLTEARYLPARLVQTSPSRRKDEARHPEGSATLIDLDLSRYDRIASRFRREQEESLALLKSGIATRNAAFNRSIEQIERVAVRSRAPMLLVGPTGAGKSFLARRIYELKRSRHQLDGRFVEVNCATLRGDGAMSALFGHVKGAFTGAQNAREGLLRAADGGMLFLDEIGELGADEQAMLLKAIEEKRFFPLGSDREVESDFQLIAGTHRDLRGRVAEGLFREDLFARINLWTFELPGLAGRREDIRAEHRLRTGAARPRARAAGAFQPGGQASLPGLRRFQRSALGRQLPRAVGFHHTDGDPGRQRADRRGAGRGGDPPPAPGLGARCGPGATGRSAGAADGGPGSVRPPATAGGAGGVPRG